MSSLNKLSRRRRGVILSTTGLQRVQTAQYKSELTQNGGNSYTLEYLSELTGLSPTTLGRLRSHKTSVDRQTLEVYFRAFGLTLTPTDYNYTPFYSGAIPPSASQPTPLPHQQDWDKAVDVSIFHGRTEELAKLKQWTIDDRCRLVSIFGMVGVGKTTLSIRLAKQIQSDFEFVIWRSLCNTPSLESLLGELVPFLSNQQEVEPDIRHFLRCLKSSRCLVILDGMESLFQAGNCAGCYLSGYEQYGEFLQVVGESGHQSCLILTSREKPSEIAWTEGIDAGVRSLSLGGSFEASKALMQIKGLMGTEAEQHNLCGHYSCNPLALRMIATSIQDLFGGQIRVFLEQNIPAYNPLRRLFDRQFKRLTNLERNIMFWLAINQEPTAIANLETDILPTVPRAELLEALESLSRRYLIERQDSRYTQKTVIMEYIVNQFVEQLRSDLSEEIDVQLFNEFQKDSDAYFSTSGHRKTDRIFV